MPLQVFFSSVGRILSHRNDQIFVRFQQVRMFVSQLIVRIDQLLVERL